MKQFFILLLVLSGCTNPKTYLRESLPLAGEWKFKIDSLDQGIEQQWFTSGFNETVRLPGSMAENGKGSEVTVKTDWTGDIVDRSYFTNKKYERYRRPGNIKIPFWLKPVKYYKGPAWYQKEIEIPEKWSGKRIVLFLESVTGSQLFMSMIKKQVHRTAWLLPMNMTLPNCWCQVKTG